MKLFDILLLGFTIAFLIIGIDQTLVLGFGQAYWAFMLASVTFFLFTFRKSRKQNSNGNLPASPPPGSDKLTNENKPGKKK